MSKQLGNNQDTDDKRLTNSVLGILPWRVEFDQASHGESMCVVDGGGSILAKTPVPLLKTDEARLRMMAASPKLLEALKAAYIELPMGSALSKVEAAIAKAEGRGASC